MSKKDIFLVIDCNRPGTVYAIDQEWYNWMTFNGSCPARISVEKAQVLLTNVDRDMDEKWGYSFYSPLPVKFLKEMQGR